MSFPVPLEMEEMESLVESIVLWYTVQYLKQCIESCSCIGIYRIILIDQLIVRMYMLLVSSN